MKRTSLQKICSLLFLLTISTSRLIAQEAWTDHSRLMPDRLKGLPTAIMIYHSPTPVYPEVNTDTANYPGKYIWRHNTQVTATVTDLEVVAAGSYIWFAAKGWVTNIVMDKNSFAKKFNCPNGMLKKGNTYIFGKNYRFGDALYAGDALWFVIAKDKSGRLFKGVAIVETEGILKQ